MKKQLIGILIVIIALGVSLVFIFSRKKQPKSRKKTKTTKALYLLNDSYVVEGRFFNMLSYNRGEDWMVLEYHEKRKPNIIGKIEDIHPQVMYDREYWHALIEYVRKKGSIALHDRRAVKMLKRCGFDVRVIK